MVTEYWKAIEQKVCNRCVDGDEKGHCMLSSADDSALKNYFPALVHLVHVTKSDNTLDHMTALRHSICIQCCENSDHGSCTLRNSFRCPLDRYFPRVNKKIEEVQPLRWIQ